MVIITYIEAVTLHIHTQGRFDNHTAHDLYSIKNTAASVMGVRKMGNIVHRAGIECTYLTFRASYANHDTT